MSNSLRKLDTKVRAQLRRDEELRSFLRPYFNTEREVDHFVRENLSKAIAKRRTMLRLHWFVDLANRVNEMEPGRPSLPLIFLFAMAEGIEKLAQDDDDNDSQAFNFISDFFKYITDEDKTILRQRFRRSIAARQNHVLRFKSILKILWHARCNAAHGREYWHLLLPDKEQDIGWEMITSGQMGKPNRKRRVPIDTTLTYEELRDIFVRTAIRRITSL